MEMVIRKSKVYKMQGQGKDIRYLLRAELRYPYCIDLTEVVSTFDKVDRGVTRLCRIKIYEN